MHMHMCMCMQEEVDAAVFHATAADAGRVRPAGRAPMVAFSSPINT